MTIGNALLRALSLASLVSCAALKTLAAPSDADPMHQPIEWRALAEVSPANVAAGPASRLQPHVVLQSGHRDTVNDLSYSPNGELLLSCGYEMKLWRAKDGVLLYTSPRQANSCAFSRDGKRVYINEVLSFSVLDLADMSTTLRVEDAHKYSLSAIWPSPDGSLILTCANDDTSKLWTNDGKLVRTLSVPASGSVKSCAFSPDGAIVAAGSRDNKVHLYSTRTGEHLRVLEGHEGAVTSLAFSPDGSLIATGSDDDTVGLFSIGGRRIGRAKGSDSNVERVVFHPSGDRILSIAGDYVFQWSASLGALGRLRAANRSNFALAVHPNGRQFATAGMEKSIRVWSSQATLVREFGRAQVGVRGAAFRRDGRELYSVDDNGVVSRFGLDELSLKSRMEVDGNGSDVSLSPSGRYLAVSSIQRLRVFDTRTGARVHTFKDSGQYGSCDPTWIDEDVIACPRVLTFPSNRYEFIVRRVSDRSERAVATFEISRPPGIHKAVIDRAGRYGMLSFSESKDVFLVDLRATSPQPDTLSFDAPVCSTNIHPNGELMVVSHLGKKALTLFNLKTRKVEKQVEAPDDCASRIEFSPDGRLLALNSRMNLRLLDTQTWKVVRELGGTGVYIDDVRFSASSSHLVTSTRDGILRLVEIGSSQSIMLAVDGSEWMAYADDGFFDASVDGGALVAYVKGVEPYAIDQFAPTLNRPDVLLERMKLGSATLREALKRQALKRQKRAGLTEAGKDRAPPVSTLFAGKRDGKWLDVEWSCAQVGALPVTRHSLYVNGVPLFGAQARPVDASRSGKERIELSFGRNRIEHACIDGAGQESLRSLVYADDTTPRTPELYVLAFGVSRYADSKLDLRYAAKDARDISGVFARMTKRFGKVNVRTLTDEQVTPMAIKESKVFLEGAKVDDTVVLFVAGHGMYDENETYHYLTHAAKVEDLANTAASFESVESLLQGINARQKLFLLDTCESGELDPDVATLQTGLLSDKRSTARGLQAARGLKSGGRSPSLLKLNRDRYIFGDLLRRSGAIVFSSSRGGELSYESEAIENGYFTKEILRALSSPEADTDKDQAISTDELRRFVSTEVAKRSSDLQHPTVDRDNLLQKFVFERLGN